MPKILAIDDINDNLISLKAIISDAFPGAVVFTALNGPKGIELAIDNNPDVILLDVIMPGMDGFEVCRQLKQDERVRDIPVVFLTAIKGDKESRIKALEVGAEGFLSKPIEETELIAQIRAMVKIKAANEQKRNEKERLEKLVDERTASLKNELEERKKAEESLQESEDRFQMLFNQAPLGYQSLDIDGYFIEVNQQWLDTLGFTREEVIGKWFGDFLSPDYKEGFRKRFPLFKAQGHIHSEFEMVHKNGTILFIAFEGKIGYNLDGGFKQTHCILQDITQSKKAEEALTESEEKYSILFNDSPDAYLIISEGFFVDCNKATEIMLRGDRTQIIGQAPDEISPEIQPDGKKSSDSAAEKIACAFENGKNTFEWMHRRFDGSDLYVEVSIAPMKLKGKLTLFTTWRDISARKLAEKALRESEAQFREFFEKAADAIFIADIETGMIVDANQAATRLMNRSYEQLVGIHQSQLHPPVLEKYAKETFNNHKKLVKQNLPSNALENSIVRADGTEVPVEILAAEVDYHGKRCMIGTFRDITERKKSEKEILESEAKYRYMFQHNPQPMWIYDHDTLEILEVNEISTKIYGYTREEFLSMTIKDIRPAEDIPFMLEDVEASRLEENSIGEWRHSKKSGEIMNVEISASSIVFNGRKARHVLIKDITERKQAEESLRQSEEKYRRMVDLIPDAVIVHSEGKIVFANSATYSLLDATSSDQVIGKSALDFVHPESRVHAYARIKKIYETGEPSGFAEEKFITFNNEVLDAEVIGIPVIYMGKPAIQTILRNITDRKHAEEKMSSIFRVAPTGIGVVANRVFLEVNPRITEMTGFSKEELIGQSSRMLYQTTEEFEFVGREKYDQIAKKGTGVLETRWMKKDGSIIHILLSSTPLNQSDISKGVIFTALDITDRKESEIALQESEERYRRFISQVSEGVYRFESDEPMDISLPVEEQIDFIYNHLSIAECNDAFLKMYGFTSQKEMLGKTMIDLHDGRNNESNRNVMRNFVENNYHVEDTLTEELNAQGQKLYLSNTSIGILENNKLVRIWGTQSDISSRVRDSHVQQVLYSISNAALSSIDLSELVEFISKEIGKLLDSTNFYIAFYDEETNMLSTLYERDEKDVLDSWSAEKSITGYVIRHQKSMRITRDEVQKLCDSGEIEIVGTPCEVWLGVPLIMNKDVIGALVVQSYDDPEAYTEQDKLMLEFISHQISISIERKIAEQELNAALAKAQESDRLKSSFLANMSHEIRTPLNSIIGFSELMSDPDFDISQQSDFSKMINSSGNNLLAIITDIMDLSKIEAGQVVVRKEPVSVNNLISDIHKEYSFMAAKKGIRLDMDLSEIDEQLEIESDESALRKILINFVGNAIKFTKDGFIEIGVKPVGKYLQFHVKDSGIGIPAEFHNTIFERFRQIESFSTRKYGGNGLGLAISKSLVELLGGKIWMESESGKGSTFYFSVPIGDNNY